ncbi:metallophosphoesterase family protein [Oricola indica]|jgi:Icc-related predicted phosphoesterase|uniref:metallophosphoesterase family protein n=1 Tax=Oricola indica TaxID=2872591 RepID=UPI001CBB8204|nr:metallophosphoesterase [Oricola indica]
MQFLVVADIHYALKQYDWLLEVAPHYEAVVIAGDLLEVSSMVDRRAQIVVLRTYLRSLGEKTRIIVCSGNHDLDGEREDGERVADWMLDLGDLGVVSDGESVTISGVRFSSFPWWDGEQTKKQVLSQLEADAELAHDHWVWVYHAPPADKRVSWGGQRHFGDPDLVGWIERFHPDLVLGGHVHQSPFIPDGSWVDRVGETWVFNTGQQPGERPTIIAFNLDRKEAVWLSMMGGQAQSLAEPLPEPARLMELPGWITI